MPVNIDNLLEHAERLVAEESVGFKDGFKRAALLHTGNSPDHELSDIVYHDDYRLGVKYACSLMYMLFKNFEYPDAETREIVRERFAAIAKKEYNDADTI